MLELLGAGGFGLVVGWITYRALRRRQDKAALSDLAAVLAAIGGGAVTGLFPEPRLFGAYGIGLAVGFFSYLTVGWLLDQRRGKDGGDNSQVDDWMGDREH
jgi:hypothetical protein